MVKEIYPKRKAVDECLAAHDVDLHGFTAKVSQQDTPIGLGTDQDTEIDSYVEKSSFIDPKQAIDQFSQEEDPEPTLRDEILALFQEDQERILTNPALKNCNLRYGLLDEGFTKVSSDCPQDIIEDDYSSESRP